MCIRDRAEDEAEALEAEEAEDLTEEYERIKMLFHKKCGTAFF